MKKIKEIIGVELTGSPEGCGYDTKKELLDFLQTKGYEHQKLSTAKILLTDSLESETIKMETARKKGIQIITYIDFVEGLE